MPGPSGTKLRNPFPTIVTFSLNPTISLWEVETGLPGPEGGEPIDTVTMRNTLFRTKDPRILQEIMAAPMQFAYDPQALPAISGMINKNQLITWTFPTGGTWAIWAYLKSFKPNPNTIDDKMPLATAEIVPTMHNNSDVETGFTVGTTTSSTSTTTTTS